MGPQAFRPLALCAAACDRRKEHKLWEEYGRNAS